MLTAAAVVAFVTTACATPSLIVNGTFDTGTLAGWTVFETANGTVGPNPATVTPFNVTGRGISDAATFQVGEAIFSGRPAGGGIRQDVCAAAGVYVFSADFAFFNPLALATNADAGTASVLIDNEVEASFAGGIIGPHQTIRDHISFGEPLASGRHQIEILFTRDFAAIGGLPTPLQYVDNVELTLPEPAILALFGVALGGLMAARHRRGKRPVAGRVRSTRDS